MLKHEHIIIRAELNDPPGKSFMPKINAWFSDLIESIGMVKLLGPYSVYCETKGNEGITSICAIETSSITLHIWDGERPGVLQLDIYSCADLDISIVLDKLQQFKPVKIQYLFLDRDQEFKIKELREIVY